MRCVEVGAYVLDHDLSERRLRRRSLLRCVPVVVDWRSRAARTTQARCRTSRLSAGLATPAPSNPTSLPRGCSVRRLRFTRQRRRRTNSRTRPFPRCRRMVELGIPKSTCEVQFLISSSIKVRQKFDQKDAFSRAFERPKWGWSASNGSKKARKARTKRLGVAGREGGERKGNKAANINTPYERLCSLMSNSSFSTRETAP